MDYSLKFARIAFFMLFSTVGILFAALSCGDPIWVDNTIHILAGNVNSAGTCFDIAANNVTIDCNGFTINYSRSSQGFGVNLTGDFTYSTVRNCNIIQGDGSVADSEAIHCDGNCLYTDITNNNITTYGTNSYGINSFSWFNNSAISSNNITVYGSQSRGILVFQTQNLTISDNSISTNDSFGVNLQGSPSNFIMNNNITTNGTSASGTYLVFSSNNTLTGNNITTNGSDAHGISVSSSQNNNLTSNIVNTNGTNANGIDISSSQNNTLTGNNITTSGNNGRGISLSSSSNNNTLTGNNITANNSVGRGIILQGSSNNSLIGNEIITDNNAEGIHLQDSSNSNNLENNSVSSVSSTFSNVIAIELSTNNTLIGNTIVGISGTGIFIFNNGQNNTFYNNLINSTTPVVFSGTVYQNFWNTTLTLLGSGTNIAGGDWIGGNFYATPSGSGFSESAISCIDTDDNGICDYSYSLGANNVDYLPLAAQVRRSQCGQLAQPDVVYTLADDVNSNDTCFTISANDVTLDCRGHTINYSRTGTGYGIKIITGYNHTTIRNCNIVQVNSTTGSSHGIFLQSSSNNDIFSNNNITTNGSGAYGIYLNVNSSNNNLINNNITTTNSSAHGINLNVNSSNNNLTGNVINTTGTGANGIFIYNISNNNILTGNNITTSGPTANGINLNVNSSSNNLTGNVINTTGTGAIGINVGASSNNNLTNNNISTRGNSSNGVMFNANNSVASFNTITIYGGNSSNGISVGTNATNNTIESNNITMRGRFPSATATTGRPTGIAIGGPPTSFTYLAMNTVRNNTVTLAATALRNRGIIISNSANVTAIDNTVISYANESRGLIASGGVNCTVTGNTITIAAGTDLSNGISIATMTNMSLFAGNNVTVSGSNGYGIFMNLSNNNSLSGNRVTAGAGAVNYPYLYVASSSDNNMTNATFAAANSTASYGSVRYPQEITLPSDISLDLSGLNISWNGTLNSTMVYLNTSNSTINIWFNRSAHITLHELSFVTASPLVDFNDDGLFDSCVSSQCTGIGYSVGTRTLEFDVASFTTYAANGTLQPIVAITSPLNGATLTSWAVTVAGTATDTNLDYTNISILQGSTLIDSTTSAAASFSVSLSVPTDGTYTITAIAYDLGNNNASVSVNVTVTAATAPVYPPSPSACYPSWSCTGWSECSFLGTMTRTCIDTNGCGTTSGKPLESMLCGAPETECGPNWICSEFGECTRDSVQSRNCSDTNLCGTVAGMPNQTRNCFYITPQLTPVSAVEREAMSRAQAALGAATDALAAKNYTGAALLLNEAVASTDEMISASLTESNAQIARTILNAVLDGTRELIDNGAGSEASGVLVGVSNVAGKIAVVDSAVTDEIVLGAMDQGNILLKNGNFAGAENVFSSAQGAVASDVSKTLDLTDSMQTEGVDPMKALGLDELGMSLSSMAAAETKNDEAGRLIANAKVSSDDASKTASLTKAGTLMREALAALPEIRRLAKKSTIASTSAEGAKALREKASNDESRRILGMIESWASTGGYVSVQKDLVAYAIMNRETGDKEINRTVVTLQFSSSRQMNNLTIVEYLPKGVAASADDLLLMGGSPAPVVLERDPMVSWTFGFVTFGETKRVSYALKSILSDIGSTTLAAGEVVFAPIIQPPSYVEITYPERTTTMRLIVAIIAGAGILFMMKMERDKIGPKPGVEKLIEPPVERIAEPPIEKIIEPPEPDEKVLQM